MNFLNMCLFLPQEKVLKIPGYFSYFQDIHAKGQV